MNIYGNKVVLRALEPGDMPYLREMINDPEMEKMVIGWSFPISEKQQIDCTIGLLVMIKIFVLQSCTRVNLLESRR